MTREEAIEWLNRIEDKYIHGGDDDFDAKRKQALGIAIEALKADRPRGAWLKVIDHDGILMEYYVCDKCGMLTTDCSNFCPNCGAKMDRGGDAE